MIPTATNPEVLSRLHAEITKRERFLITSHARPDGDSLGSQLALLDALQSIGKKASVVNRDVPPTHYQNLPGINNIEIADRVTGDFDAAIVLESGNVDRPGLNGLDRYFIINIDHHVGNTMFGAINWIDESAAACAEMIFELIDSLGVQLTTNIATNIYVAILTDTGSFRHANITSRTCEICRTTVEAGADPPAIARRVYDTNSIGKLKLMGTLLTSMTVENNGKIAILYLDDNILNETGCSDSDTEGLINLPLTIHQIRAVVFFKVINKEVRVSLRSKDSIDVRAVATTFGGGGHKNASGCIVNGTFQEVRMSVINRLTDEIRGGG